MPFLPVPCPAAKRPPEIQIGGLGSAVRFLLRYSLERNQLINFIHRKFVDLIYLIYLVAVVAQLPLGALSASLPPPPIGGFTGGLRWP